MVQNNQTNERSTSGRVLLAEDDDDLRLLLAAALKEGGFEVVECASGMDLVQTLDLSAGTGGIEDYDALITDIRMPGVTGMEVLEGLTALGRHCPVILITGFGDRETQKLAHRMGAAALLDKPFSGPRLLREVNRVIQMRRRLSAVWDEPKEPGD